MRRRLVALNIEIPISIAATNYNVRVLPKPMEASAGPKAVTHQAPSRCPNSSAPHINDLSTRLAVGATNSVAQRGAARRFAGAKLGSVTPSAPSMTHARLGSQSPAMSRRASTLAGSIMWETIRPRPNRMPETAAQTMAGMRSAPRMWRVIKTVVGTRAGQIARQSGRVSSIISRPAKPVAAVAAGAPTMSASQPSPTKPTGPIPMQTDNTPSMRLRISGGAAR
jgi:hypothetical protein